MPTFRSVAPACAAESDGAGAPQGAGGAEEADVGGAGEGGEVGGASGAVGAGPQMGAEGAGPTGFAEGAEAAGSSPYPYASDPCGGRPPGCSGRSAAPYGKFVSVISVPLSRGRPVRARSCTPGRALIGTRASPGRAVSASPQARGARCWRRAPCASGVRRGGGPGAAVAHDGGVLEAGRCGIPTGARSRLDRDESLLADHLEVSGRRYPSRGEVVAEEERVRGVQRERLEGAQVQLPAAGEPDLGLGACEAGEHHDLQALRRGEIPSPFHGRAVEGDEEVDRDRVGPHVAQ